MNDISVIEKEFGDLSPYSEPPGFWVSKPEAGMRFMETLEHANVRVIGTTAGGREISARVDDRHIGVAGFQQRRHLGGCRPHAVRQQRQRREHRLRVRVDGQ